MGNRWGRERVAGRQQLFRRLWVPLLLSLNDVVVGSMVDDVAGVSAMAPFFLSPSTNLKRWAQASCSQSRPIRNLWSAQHSVAQARRGLAARLNEFATHDDTDAAPGPEPTRGGVRRFAAAGSEEMPGWVSPPCGEEVASLHQVVQKSSPANITTSMRQPCIDAAE